MENCLSWVGVKAAITDVRLDLRRRAQQAGHCGLLGVLAVAMAGPARAGRLNDTGQNTCFDSHGIPSTNCAGTGQDAAYGADVSSPRNKDGLLGFQFGKVCGSGEQAGTGSCPAKPKLGQKINQWACTRDKKTGLLWEVKTNDGGFRDVNALFTNWGNGRAGDSSQYVAAVNATNLCGSVTWRMPTAKELQGLVRYVTNASDPAIDLDWFPNSLAADGFSLYYVEDVTATDSSLEVAFSAGGVVDEMLRSYGGRVRLVSGGATPARYVAAGAEVQDKSTGLIWKRCEEGQTWNGVGCGGVAVGMNWFEALAAAQAQSGAGWRLPNAKEALSLMDTSQGEIAIDQAAFPNTAWVPIWSNTAFTEQSGMLSGAWALYFNPASLQRVGGTANVRLVREP
jgi:hypothetical protein